MATVKYVGPFAEGVDINVDGRWRRVLQGGTLEVSDADAKSLCEQEANWQAVKAAPPPKEKQRTGRTQPDGQRLAWPRGQGG